MRRLLALLAVLVLPATAVAAQPPASAVADLQVTRSGGTVTVSGTATFGDASDAVLATDPSGDVQVAGIGADLTAARVDDAGEQLVFTLSVADPLTEPLFTLPEVMHYLWYIRVTNGRQSNNFQLLAMRSGQYKRAVPFPDYLFRVNSCGSTASGNPNCFDVAGIVEGTMAGGTVQWRVPKSLIAALPGAVIDAPPTSGSTPFGAESAPGASGAAYVRGSDRGDLLVPTPYVVGPAVALSLKRAGSSGAYAYDSAASLGPDGTFVAKLAVPSFGDYVLGARACHGDAAGCGFAETAVPAAS